MPWTHTTPINLLLALEDEHLPHLAGGQKGKTEPPALSEPLSTAGHSAAEPEQGSSVTWSDRRGEKQRAPFQEISFLT